MATVKLSSQKLRQSTHDLIEYRSGTNRYRPGEYVCRCGEIFTGFNKYEIHRAAARREAKQ